MKRYCIKWHDTIFNFKQLLFNMLQYCMISYNTKVYSIMCYMMHYVY